MTGNKFLCIITKEELSIFKSLKKQPIFMGTTNQNINADKFMDQNWAIGKSGIVQLTERVDLMDLYKEGHNSGLIGSVWKEHHEAFAKFACKNKFSKVLELGGGHGVLSKNVNKILPSNSQDWTIIEPSNKAHYSKHIKKINSLFDQKTNTGEKYDIILHSHLFEHLYQPLDILKNISKHLVENGIMCFAIPNMQSMLKTGVVSSINFEHTIYLPENLVEGLLKASGFKVIDKTYFKSNHSIFYSCLNTGNFKDFTYDSYDKNFSDVQSFFYLKEKEILELNKKIDKINRPIFIFGAHIFSQFLICNGLNTTKVAGILDNDHEKQNKRLYGTSLNVFSPEVIKEKEVFVILRAGAYESEIKRQLKNLTKLIKII